MTLPAAIQYGQIRWKAVQSTADGSDVDALPDPVPVTGSVTFDLRVPLLTVGTDPTTVFVSPHTYHFDLTGVLRDAEGRELISLIATDSEDVSPQGMTWRAIPHITSGPRMEPFYFDLPAGTVVDLTEVMPLPASNGVPIVRGPQGDPGPQGDVGPTGPAGGGWTAVDATTTVKGIVELATTAETTTGTDTVRAVTPAGVKAATDLLYAPAPSGGDDTAALQAALNALPTAGGRLVLRPGVYNCTALTPPNNAVLQGAGVGTIINYTGASGGTLVDLTSKLYVRFVDLTLTGSTSTTASYTLLHLYNTFSCEFRGVRLVGGHNPGSSQPSTTGLALRGNAGDNHFIGCRWNNLGVAIRTDSIQNYVIGGHIGYNQRGVWGDSGNYGAGLSVMGTTFVGAPGGSSIAHAVVDVNANQFTFTNCWFEGATTAVQIGSTDGTMGPLGFAVIGCHVAASTYCIRIHGSRQTFLSNVVFGFDPATTPAEVSFGTGSSANNGIAMGLVSGQAFEVSATWPAGWTVIRPDTVELPRLKITQATTSTTSPAAGGAGALPATPLGYVTVEIAGGFRKIAYY